MARLITPEEMLKQHGAGYMEDLFLGENQDWKAGELYLRPCVWLDERLFDEGGTMPIERANNEYYKPTSEELDYYRDEEEIPTIGVGSRVWDSEPTMEEMKNTPWKEVENNG